jgi:hypothetical protein
MPKNNSVNDPGVPHLPLSGGTMTGALYLNANPTTALQSATKSYVDSQAGQPPIGSLAYFATGGSAGNTYMNPQWIPCDGSTYSQSTYTTLYARVGLINASGVGTWTT